MVCPFCNEPIQDGAIKCKHCQSLLTITCPMCKEVIPENSSKCPHCEAAIQPVPGGQNSASGKMVISSEKRPFSSPKNAYAAGFWGWMIEPVGYFYVREPLMGILLLFVGGAINVATSGYAIPVVLFLYLYHCMKICTRKNLEYAARNGIVNEFEAIQHENFTFDGVTFSSYYMEQSQAVKKRKVKVGPFTMFGNPPTVEQLKEKIVQAVRKYEGNAVAIESVKVKPDYVHPLRAKAKVYIYRV